MTVTEPFTTTIDVGGYTHVRGRGAQGPRDPGGPELAVLVRPPARGDARHPPGRRVPPGREPGRADGRDRGRPLRRPALLSARVREEPARVQPPAQAVGPRMLQLMTPALWSSTRVTAVASDAQQPDGDDRLPGGTARVARDGRPGRRRSTWGAWGSSVRDRASVVRDSASTGGAAATGSTGAQVRFGAGRAGRHLAHDDLEVVERPALHHQGRDRAVAPEREDHVGRALFDLPSRIRSQPMCCGAGPAASSMPRATG